MTVFLTFRLWDSLPAAVVRAYAEERRIFERRLAREGTTAELLRDARSLFSEHIETALDGGIGACLLRRPEAAELVLETIRHFDDERYVVHAACVMPNHVHAVITPAPNFELSSITHSWKSFTANQLQRRLGHQGPVWQDETYDHIIRNQAEFDHYIRYTLDNPAKAHRLDWPYVHCGLDQLACEESP